MGNVVVRHATAIFDISTIAIDSIIPFGVVFGVWVFHYDVPRVQQPRNISEAAQGNVDYRVRSTQSDLNPYYSKISELSAKGTWLMQMGSV